MSKPGEFASLPGEHRKDLLGRPVCRWCGTKMEEHTYVPLKKRKRQVTLLCPRCDVAATTSIHHEFGI